MSTILSAALFYISIGLRIIRLKPNDKRPFDRNWQNENATNDPDRAKEWFKSGKCGIGIPTGEINQIIVIDCDTDEIGRKIYRDNVEIITGVPISKTSRGCHYIFGQPDDFEVRNSTGDKSKGEYDLRGTVGYIVAPPTIINGFQYHWVKGHELTEDRLQNLPTFRREWLPKKEPIGQPAGDRANNVPINPDDIADLRRRVLNYLSTIRAVSGERGHNATYRACAIMRDKFQVPPHEAWTILQLWNQSGAADPPWDLKSLHHKFQDVFLKQPQTQN